jgi:4-hydroxyphenylacetate 3-monooxygenase
VYPRLVEIVQILGSSGLANIPSEASVFSEELASDIERYYQGASIGGKERIRLFRLAWDVACSSFAGRQVLYERYFAGDFHRNVATHFTNSDKSKYRAMVEGMLNREPSEIPS